PPDLDRTRPGIVHRLDKGTSGLMVVARHPRAREHLKAQFAAHSIEREYVAICVGDVAEKTFETLHGRHPTDRLRFSSKVKTGKRACTHVRPIERFGGHATYVSCRLETGRTHQIRVHLASIGHPVVGDDTYGGGGGRRLMALPPQRHFLHAAWLIFPHPVTGAPIDLRSPLPADLARSLAAAAGSDELLSHPDPLDVFGFYRLDS
ncbi:MAG TPA: RluA family pseudouridine synthase, partial [Gemmatimonadaceae bacterium]|nr:RluA family pseudouridine synthase [Gemmatimonadaceae bacterium]